MVKKCKDKNKLEEVEKYGELFYRLALGMCDEKDEKIIFETLKKEGQKRFLVREIIKREPGLLLKFWKNNRKALDDKELDSEAMLYLLDVLNNIEKLEKKLDDLEILKKILLMKNSKDVYKKIYEEVDEIEEVESIDPSEWDA